MSRRTLVLLVIAIAVWSVAIVYLLLPKGGEAKGEAVSVKVPRRSAGSIDITPELIKGYVSVCDEGIRESDPFTPYILKEGEEGLRMLVLRSDSTVDYIKFGGYIIGSDGKGRIFLDVAGEKVMLSPDDLVDGRYMIVYISSMGLVVLDVMKGGLYVIR